MKRPIQSLLLLLLTTSLCLLLLEGLLQVLNPPHAPGVGTRYTPKARLYGWALPPGARLSFIDPDTGDRSLFKINSAGWKDVEHEIEKPSGTFRILFVGDSYTYGYCPLEDLYTRQVEHLLRARGRSDVEVISMGVGSWGTDHALEVLRNEGLKYEPDLVIYQFCSNDITDNIQPDLADNMDPIHWNKPFKYELRAGELVRMILNPRIKYKTIAGETVAMPIRWKLSARERIVRFLLLKSALAYNLNTARHRLASSFERSSGDAKSPRMDPIPHPIYDPDSPWSHEKSRNDSASLAAAMSLFDALLLEMDKSAASQDAGFLVFAANALWRRDLAESCGRLGIPLLLPPEEGYETYSRDGHFNSAGNRQAAGAIVAFLSEGGWLARSRVQPEPISR